MGPKLAGAAASAAVHLHPKGWMLLQIAVLPHSGDRWPAVTSRRAEQITDCSSCLAASLDSAPLAADFRRRPETKRSNNQTQVSSRSMHHTKILFSPLIYRVFSSPSIPEKFRSQFYYFV